VRRIISSRQWIINLCACRTWKQALAFYKHLIQIKKLNRQISCHVCTYRSFLEADGVRRRLVRVEQPKVLLRLFPLLFSLNMANMYVSMSPGLFGVPFSTWLMRYWLYICAFFMVATVPSPADGQPLSDTTMGTVSALGRPATVFATSESVRSCWGAPAWSPVRQAPAPPSCGPYRGETE
jgi:hypothetical protein